MSENKKQSGYAILKAKIAKKDLEIETLKKNVADLKNIISVERGNVNDLVLDLSREQKNASQLREMYHTALHQMGWLRRLIYGY